MGEYFIDIEDNEPSNYGCVVYGEQDLDPEVDGDYRVILPNGVRFDSGRFSRLGDVAYTNKKFLKPYKDRNKICKKS